MSTQENQAIFDTTLKLYNHPDASEQEKRTYAVSAALELIKAEALNARERNTTTIERHLSKLSDYADEIQRAIDKA